MGFRGFRKGICEQMFVWRCMDATSLVIVGVEELWMGCDLVEADNSRKWA